jgi:hypothetical protein
MPPAPNKAASGTIGFRRSTTDATTGKTLAEAFGVSGLRTIRKVIREEIDGR